MFKKILNYFIESSAKKNISKNPLVMAALLRSQHVMKETGLDKIPDQMKEPAQELAEDILTIINSDNQLLAMRGKYAEAILVYARYQVLVNDTIQDDPNGLVGLPGITGKLREHLVKIGEDNSLIKKELHGLKGVPDKITLQYMKDFVRGRYLFWYWRQAVFNTLRIGMKDMNQNAKKDWEKHFFYSVCVCHEYDFRFTIKLKENIDFPQKLMNSTFLDIVLSGEKYPDLAFYEANKEAIENKQLFFKKVW